eukprot:TRINITY_DN1136_c0_g1_i1.p1 TRINITY_DN1136_c0_g1~~TRINITY_DN1136_c0_g1_i1.p1  ORF type:complete len:114 (+),score=30.69 TRINITY_DN1136_c0_g1_i1:20-361(+)
MSDTIQNLQVNDPWDGLAQDDDGAGRATGNVHIRVQQRNGRKSITTIQGLSDELDLKKILKEVKKEFCCNGSIVQDKELGTIIQLQGDQRENIRKFLLEFDLVDKDKVRLHGV